MLSPLMLILSLQIPPGTPPVPAGWFSSSNQTLLEASGPSQSVKIPVTAWDPETQPAAPDVSFSYSVTGSDKDTFYRIVNPNTTPVTIETQQFPQGVTLTDIEINYTVVGGTSGYANGTHSWVFAGQGFTIAPKPKKGEFEPKIIPAETYINRHQAEDGSSLGNTLYDNPYTVNVALSRAAYVIWIPKPDMESDTGG
jgi:hypothetical protein